jgi:hypothetical protein
MICKERRIEWKGIRAIDQARERWKALFKPSTYTGRKASNKRSKVNCKNDPLFYQKRI